VLCVCIINHRRCNYALLIFQFILAAVFELLEIPSFSISICSFRVHSIDSDENTTKMQVRCEQLNNTATCDKANQQDNDSSNRWVAAGHALDLNVVAPNAAEVEAAKDQSESDVLLTLCVQEGCQNFPKSG